MSARKTGPLEVEVRPVANPMGLPGHIRDHIRYEPNGCWRWEGYSVRGYGRVSYHGKTRIAHRLIYQLLGGIIPVGLQLDHLCRTPACVNPTHLRPVTARENTMAPLSRAITKANAEKTHCPKGHPYSGKNLHIRPLGHRGCRKCGVARSTRFAARVKAEERGEK